MNEDNYWDCIAVTAPKYEHAEEFLKELQNRQNEGIISKKTFLISIPDPYINTGYMTPIHTTLDSEHRNRKMKVSYDDEDDEENEEDQEQLFQQQNRQHTQSTKVGSGSSMINSLFVITEKLSALSGKSYLDVDILKNKRILLLLNGGVHQHAPLVNLCTKSFSMMPLKNVNLVKDTQNSQGYCDTEKKTSQSSQKKFVGDTPVYPIDILLSNLNLIVPHLQAGFMISSTESLIFFDQNDSNLNNPTVWKQPGVSVVTMNVGKDYYTNHGMCRLNSDNEILEIAYKKPKEYLEKNQFINSENDTASIYTGLVFFCEKTTEKLLYLHNAPPLDSCTYLGVDSGSQLLKFGVFPDILCSMTKNETLDSFLKQPCFYDTHKKLVERARKVVWDTFRNTQIHSIKINGEYHYLKNPIDFLNFIYTNVEKEEKLNSGTTGSIDGSTTDGSTFGEKLLFCKISKKMHSFIACQETPVKGIVINSILMGNGKTTDTSIIYSSFLTGDNWSVGNMSIVFGVKCLNYNFQINDRIIVNEIRLKSVKIKHTQSENSRALIVLGVSDDLNSYYSDVNSTIANRKWEEFLKTSGISPDELWSNKNTPRILRTARLFPIINSDDDEKMIEASLWIQNKESPPLSVIGRWKSSKRISISDIIGESYLLDYTQLDVKSSSSLSCSSNSLKNSYNGADDHDLSNTKATAANTTASKSTYITLPESSIDTMPHLLPHSKQIQLPFQQQQQQQEEMQQQTEIAMLPSCSVNFNKHWIIEGDIEADFQWRREISFQVDSLEIEHILVQGIDQSILPFIQKWSECDVSLRKALETLDRISLSCPIQYTGRLLSCISDTLACYVNNKGGLRSGPARNSSFDKSFNYFKNHDERKGFLALIKERKKWLNSNESIIRVARHYEGAGQIVIKNIVDTCPTQLKPLDNTVVHAAVGDWITVSLPVRIDLAGGWTDTPPICYEHGGIVVNAAISIRGKNPIQARIRKISEPKLIFQVGPQGDQIVCTTISQLLDYNQPNAPAALLKSCFLQLGLINYEINHNGNHQHHDNTGNHHIIKSLKEQLELLGGGIEVCSSSDLPTGSGLGTSSILAAALVTGMAYAYGYKYTDQHLFHSVLKVEQMLTTGGGWQDQIGGVLGGFKIGKCSQFHSKSDRINVTVEQLPISDSTIRLVNDHILLIYTGRTRLARDLLQDVIRRWYAKTPEILANTDELISTTTKMKSALLSADIVEMGRCLIEYWNQKKAMAIGAEPTRITEIINLVKDHTHGYSLAGAGGGGFMILITKEHCDIAKAKLKQVIGSTDGLETVEIFDADINTHGIDIKIEKHVNYLQVPPPMSVTH